MSDSPTKRGRPHSPPRGFVPRVTDRSPLCFFSRRPEIILVTRSGPGRVTTPTSRGVLPNRGSPRFAWIRVVSEIRSVRRGPNGIGAALATDVAGHLRYLASLDAVDRDRVGVVAHGDACVPAMLHEARVGGLAFTVLLSPPGISGRDNLVQGQLARLPAERREELGALMRAGIDKIIEAADRDEAIATLAKAFAAMGVPQEQATAGASGFHDQLANAWTRHFLGYDPADAFSEIESPLLALFTDTDERYPSGPNAERIRSTLREARAVHSEVRTLRGLDHFLSAQPPEGSDERPIVYADPVVEAVIGFIESAMDRSDERHLRPGR